jgi:hypothetical protein
LFNAIHAEKLILAVRTLDQIQRITTLTPMTLLPLPLLQNLKKHKQTQQHKKKTKH